MDVLVGLRRAMALRTALNYPPTDWRRFNYIAVLRDKHLFELFALDRGHPIPRTIARIEAGSIRWAGSGSVTPLDEIMRRGTIDVFAKPVVGIWGRGVFQLRADAGGISINDRPASLDELRGRLTHGYILQERIVQHQRLAGLHPASINTLRLVTAIDRGRATLIGAALRVGVGGSPVDNWGAGGLIIGVDLVNRCLRGRGLYKPGTGGSVSHHPDTGVLFDGYSLPELEEAVAMVTRFHSDLSSIHSVGWDIAMTATGPLIIEANDHWNIAIHLLVDPGFIERFEAAAAGFQPGRGSGA